MGAPELDPLALVAPHGPLNPASLQVPLKEKCELHEVPPVEFQAQLSGLPTETVVLVEPLAVSVAVGGGATQALPFQEVPDGHTTAWERLDVLDVPPGPVQLTLHWCVPTQPGDADCEALVPALVPQPLVHVPSGV